MIRGLTKLLEGLSYGKEAQADVPLDKLQLEAAQDRLTQRKADLDESVDELSKMIRRLRREQGRRGRRTS